MSFPQNSILFWIVIGEVCVFGERAYIILKLSAIESTHTHTYLKWYCVNNLGQIDINISVILIIILLHMWDQRDTCENILTLL